MNAINVIHPYKYNTQWVFDDESKELDKEPFVAGADTLLDIITMNGDKCQITFSEHKFPGAQTVVRHIGPELDGDLYYSDEYSHTLWLCPALLKYFNEPPKHIYFEVKNK